MPPEDSAHPEHAPTSQPPQPLDVPVDAMVFDVHPALAMQFVYPYASPTDLDDDASGGNPFRIRPEEIYRPRPVFAFPTTQPARYKVPQRFGMSAILGIMTALALLFGGLRLLNADPVVYLFFGMQALAICVVQMFHAQTPRFASTVAGAAILPVFVMFAAAFMRNGPPIGGILCMMIFCIPTGAFLGYLTGTCAAGIFLVMEALEPYLQGRRPASGSVASSSSPAGV